MKCREATIQISLHVGDDLPASEVPALEAHLEICTLCEAEYDSYASARDALFLLKDEHSGSTSLWEGIEQQIEHGSIAVDRSAGGRAWYRHPMFSAAMAAALLIGVTAPMWMSSAGSGANPIDLAEQAGLAEVNLSVGNSGDFGSLGVESVSDQETFDFLERNQGKVLIQDPASPIAVSHTNPNRGSY